MNNSTLYPARLGSKGFVWQVLAITFWFNLSRDRTPTSSLTYRVWL